MKQEAQLHNEYVKNYYDSHVGTLQETYEDTRWHHTTTAEFDYRQTKRAIEHTLSGNVFENAVEIGPGDGVWSNLLRAHVTGNIHLVEQSEAMLTQARARLREKDGFSFECSDWMAAHPPSGVDIIYAIRCFEYFKDKPGALKKMLNTLTPGGMLVLVTKNSHQYTTKNVQHKTLHSEQVTRAQMEKLLLDAGFTIQHVYPATFRWKASFGIMRFVFGTLHNLMIKKGGRFRVPILERYATESFIYVASKPNI